MPVMEMVELSEEEAVRSDEAAEELWSSQSAAIEAKTSKKAKGRSKTARATPHRKSSKAKPGTFRCQRRTKLVAKALARKVAASSVAAYAEGYSVLFPPGSKVVTTPATSSLDSYLSAYVDCIRRLVEAIREDCVRAGKQFSVFDGRIHEALILALLSSSGHKFGTTMYLVVDLAERRRQLPTSLLPLVQRICRSHESVGGKDGKVSGGLCPRMRAVGDSLYPKTVEEMGEATSHTKALLKMLLRVEGGGEESPVDDLHEEACLLMKNVRGIDTFRGSRAVRLMTLCGLVGGDAPSRCVASLADHAVVVRGRGPWKFCKKHGIDPTTTLVYLAKELGTTTFEAESVVCEFGHRARPPREAVFSRQSFYTLSQEGEVVSWPAKFDVLCARPDVGCSMSMSPGGTVGGAGAAGGCSDEGLDVSGAAFL